MPTDWLNGNWRDAGMPITREDMERFAERARRENTTDIPFLREAFEQFHAQVMADFKPSEEEDARTDD